MQQHPESQPQERARREQAWLAAQHEIVAHARSRFEEVAARLELPAPRARALVNAGLEIARHYARESSYANYALRTGHPWPDELHEAEEQAAEHTWHELLDELAPRPGSPAPLSRPR